MRGLLALGVVLLVVAVTVQAGGGRFGRRGGRGGYDHDDRGKGRFFPQDGLRCLQGSDCDKCGADRKKTVTYTTEGWWRSYTVTKTYCCSNCAAGVQADKSKCTCPYADTCWRGTACDGCGKQKSQFNSRTYCCRACVAAGVQVNTTYLGEICNCLAEVPKEPEVPAVTTTRPAETTARRNPVEGEDDVEKRESP